MAALALPSGVAAAASTSNSPRKGEKKRKRKVKEEDDDADLEISAEDLVSRDAEEVAVREDGEDDEDDEAEAEAPGAVLGVDVKREANRRREENLLLRGVLDKPQGERFDAFYGLALPKAAVKKLNRDIYDQNIHQNLTSVVAGMAKIFVADVVETALEIQRHSEHPTGALRPYHLQLARMRLQEQGLIGGPGAVRHSTSSSTGLRPRKRLLRR